ncbi:phospholipid-translocating P-type ATPase [Metschnikowia bicuspidata var. bicuspidata NRRL YB-4993]|uniref:Phospholipid-transporting ATPase n=1 Tax=Metschnikowia bicuspidata var. bicuspidata NRRL YB-4993 TaxID=869754 RepID=A0A1A0HIY4_9ASCO|nr:phospholipid-translocating P-type ATPase [Metschnikowia bicuspidata var. bicuspidata NRRL YB-4993]OBA23975.1 phospholipid-translocating P-type ATPase [Metschnikowia bicuspidata var. bicuspidata NRRL YB-4993]
MFPAEKEPTPTRRLRWGTTRSKAGRPRAENLNRSKTLRKLFKRDASTKQPRDAPKNGWGPLRDNASGSDSFIAVEEIASPDGSGEPAGPKQPKDPKDRRHEKRVIVFNRNLPDHLLDPETGFPVATYHRNKITTAKYTALTFFPKTIWNQFSRDIANNYFLFLIILGIFSIFGVPSPVLAAVPLIVIVCITALKDSVEDSQRTASDMEVNNQATHILSQVRDSDLGYVYINRNVDEMGISVWRRFKKWNTRILLAFLRAVKRNATSKGRAAKARQQAQPEQDGARKSFDSTLEFRRHSVAPGAMHGMARKSLQTVRSSFHGGDKTLAFERKTWKEVKVGDVLRIHNNEEVPADILILSSSDEDNCCFVETKNLDGETNLKIKQALAFSTDPKKVKRADEFMEMNFEIESEGPQPNLYSYEGAVVYEKDGEVNKESATINNLILRGCYLRNTKWIIGVVVFPGDETKIMLNSGLTPSKKSRISRQLNYYVIINFVILFVMCFVSGLASGLYYRESNTSRDYFEFGTIAGSPFKNGLVNFFVALILYQSLVPISLYITIEIIKSLQAYFIHADLGLYYEKLNFPCLPRSWGISDDLGQVEYIFSDKTGTLTQNLMEFRKCTINGVSYGRAYTEALAGLRRRLGYNVEEEARIEKAAIANDRNEMLRDLRSISANIYDSDATLVSKELVQDLKGASDEAQKAYNEEFFLALSLCHSVLVEEDPKDSKKMILKAQSPDEAALVGTARSLGFVFAGKTKRGYVVRVQGQKREYQVLNTLEFNSTRKRMSAIVKIPGADADKEPKIVLFCKGADSIIYSRLSEGNNNASFLDKTSRHLEEYATEGLRTLCIAKRELTWSEYQAWNTKYLEASSSLTDRDARVEAVADSIERELVLLGGTAIEDRLQDGVPESISILGNAGIKLWVLTGDKVETAINIGFSCNLLGNDMDLLVLKTDVLEEDRSKHDILHDDGEETIIEKLIDGYLDEHFSMTGSQEELEHAAKDHSAPNEKFGVVIDGDALKLALANPEIKRKFLLLCKQCRAVLCCRVSPAQKAAVVKMVKDTLDVMTLAIGDGSNDVAMIQAADVGIGIAGEEGRQAAMSSDYALGQFRFLTRLLLTHGRWSYKRFAEMIPSFFFKNINYTFALFWYSLFNNFDGSYLFEFTYIMFYNLAFTSLPVIFLAVFDQDVSAKVSMIVPELYRAGIMRTEFTETAFWIYAFDGLYQSFVSFFFPYWTYCQTFQLENGLGADHRFYVGMLVTCISCISANLYVWMHQYRWDYLSFLAHLFSILVIFAWTGIWTAGTWSEEFYQVGRIMFGLAMYWSCLAIGIVVCLLPRGIYDILQKFYFPKDSDIIRECVQRGEFDKYPKNYDPTDPNRENVDDPSISDKELTLVRSSGTPDMSTGTSGKDLILADDIIRRQGVTTSYYNDNSSIIDTYNLNRWSTTPLDKVNSSEDILMDDMASGLNGKKRSSRIRTSLDFHEMTTVNSLNEARAEH